MKADLMLNLLNDMKVKESQLVNLADRNCFYRNNKRIRDKQFTCERVTSKKYVSLVYAITRIK